MTTKEYLGQVGRLNKQIQNKLADIYQLKTMACSVTMTNENDRVQTSPEKDKIGMFVARIVQAEKECNDLVDRRAYIVSQIDQMEDVVVYDVLTQKYVLQKTESEIAEEKDRTERHIRRILSAARDDFEKKYGHEYLNV